MIHCIEALLKNGVDDVHLLLHTMFAVSLSVPDTTNAIVPQIQQGMADVFAQRACSDEVSSTPLAYYSHTVALEGRRRHKEATQHLYIHASVS